MIVSASRPAIGAVVSVYIDGKEWPCCVKVDTEKRTLLTGREEAREIGAEILSETTQSHCKLVWVKADFELRTTLPALHDRAKEKNLPVEKLLEQAKKAGIKIVES